jgi:predicted DCC family thiol-disulfide oxidoreductase YuxK
MNSAAHRGAVPLTTTPPAKDTVLFDGDCRICGKGARQLRAMTRGSVELISFRDESVLERFPGISFDAAMKAMQLIRRDGRVFSGAEAIVQALRGRWFGKAALAYYLPGLKQGADALYAVVARYRFRIAGRECKDGSCQLHMS